MKYSTLTLCVLAPAMISCMATAALAQQRSHTFDIEFVSVPMRTHVQALAFDDSLNLRNIATASAAAPRRKTAPAIVTSIGGLLTGTAALIGLMAATWDDPEAVPEPLVWAGYGLGTAAGAAATTAIWEKPNSGLVIGALMGAAPLILAATAESDGAASFGLLAAWIAAPIASAIGQRVGRR